MLSVSTTKCIKQSIAFQGKVTRQKAQLYMCIIQIVKMDQSQFSTFAH